MKFKTLYYFIIQIKKAKFDFFLNNIPTPKKRTYKLQLIDKINLIIKKLQWKAIIFINNNKETSELCASGLVFSLKSNTCLLRLKELIPFKHDFFDLVRNIQLYKVKNDFELKLHKDLRKVRL